MSSAPRPLEHLATMIARRLGAHPPRRPSDVDLAVLVDQRRAALGLASAEAYLQRVALAPDEELWHLAPAVTNGWTWFFRDQAPLERAIEQLGALRLGRAARIWVAGCSTGEEAYSTAIACVDRGVDAEVVGTDVDAARIEAARLGLYASAALRRVPPPVVERHFAVEDGTSWRISSSIRARVELRLHNLLDPAIAPPDGAAWDLVVCRNVLLHCADDAVSSIVTRLESALAPSGTLLLGASDPPPGPRIRGPGARPRSERPAPPRSTRPPSRVPPAPRPPAPATRSAPSADEWARVVALVQRGSLGDAREALAARLAADPACFASHATLGSLWLAEHRFDRAARSYEHAESIEPGTSELQFLWGALHRKRGAWAEAAVALRRAIFLDEEMWPARFLLAGAWERLGAHDRCRQALDATLRSIERRPRIAWRSCVDEIESLRCPPEIVRAICLQRLGRESEERSSR